MAATKQRLTRFHKTRQLITEAANLLAHQEDNMSSKKKDEEVESLKPSPPPSLAPRGIRAFTVYRDYDQTGISGPGVVIEGVKLASGQAVIHWLYPPPRGGIAIFDSMDDFIKVHILPHPTNKTIITYEDGEQETF